MLGTSIIMDDTAVALSNGHDGHVIEHADAQSAIGNPPRPRSLSHDEAFQEVRQTLERLIATFQFVERTVISTLIDGDRAAVHSRVQLRFIPKNLTVCSSRAKRRA